MKRLLAAILLFMLALTAGVAFLLLTEAGLQALLRMTLPDSITFDTARGRAIGPLSITGLEVERPRLSLRAGRLDLDVEPVSLLSGERRITALDVDELAIQLRPAETPTAAVELPSFAIADGQVRDLTVESGTLVLGVDAVEFTVLSDGERLDLERLAASAGALSLSADGSLVVAADGDLRNAPWSIAVDVAGLDPSALNDAWPAQTLFGRLTANGRGTASDLDARLDLPQYDARAMTIIGAVTLHADRLDIDTLRVGADAWPTSVTVAGTVAWSSNLALDLTGEWQDIDWSLTGLAEMRSPRGGFALSGTADDYRGSLTGDLQAPGADGRVVDSDISASFHGNSTSARVDTVAIELADGRMHGSAAIDWRGPPSLVVGLRAESFDPGLIVPQWTGALDFELDIEAQQTAARPAYRFALSGLDGVVLDRRIAGRAIAESVADGARVDVELGFGDGKLQAGGVVGETLNVDWTLDLPDIASLVPQAAGRLVGRGRITGPPAQPAVDVSANGSALSIRGATAQTFETRARFDVATGELGEMQSTLGGVRWRGVEIERVTTTISGTLDAHALSSELVAVDGTVLLELDGAFDGAAWTGRLASLDSNSDLLGRWVLESPVALSASQQGFEADEACLVDAPARVCVRANWSGSGPWAFAADIDNLELVRAQPFLPQTFNYAGRITATASLAGGESTPVTGDVDIELQAASLTIAGQDIPLAAMNTGKVTASASNDTLSLDADFDLAPQGEFEARLRAGRSVDGPLTGTLRGSVSGLEFLTLLFPELLDVTGELDIDLSVAGTLTGPLYAGDVSLRDGTASVIAAGISLEDIALSVDGDGETVNLSGSARSGDGYAAVEGSVNWLDGVAQGRLAMSGERFRFVGLPGLRVDATPDLELIMSGRELELAGDVFVDSARIEPVDLSQAVRVSPDEVVLGEGSPEDVPWRVTSRVRVTLGDDINVDAYGLTGSIRGSLALDDLPGRPATATGELAIVDGFFNAYGQALDIDRGRLSFGGGPLTGPSVDVRAERRFESITAGVQVRGPLQNPEISVYSDPPRPRQYALALLVMGATPLELGRAYDSVAYGGLGGQLDQSMGFGNGQGLGSMLSPDTYLGYLEQFNLRWRASRKWIIEIGRGIETTAGVAYLAR